MSWGPNQSKPVPPRAGLSPEEKQRIEDHLTGIEPKPATGSGATQVPEVFKGCRAVAARGLPTQLLRNCDLRSLFEAEGVEFHCCTKMFGRTVASVAEYTPSGSGCAVEFAGGSGGGGVVELAAGSGCVVELAGGSTTGAGSTTGGAGRPAGHPGLSSSGQILPGPPRYAVDVGKSPQPAKPSSSAFTNAGRGPTRSSQRLRNSASGPQDVFRRKE